MTTELRLPLRGIIPPLITPLFADGSLDERGLERVIERMIAAGIHGLFPLGTTGEAPISAAISAFVFSVWSPL